MAERPNPGSDEAIAAGCRCPRIDNNHGKWPPCPPDGWWVLPVCPVHGTFPAGGTGPNPEKTP